MADIANTVLETIEYAIDKKLASAQYDKTLLCTVTNISNNFVTLEYGGETYTVQLQNLPNFGMYDKVHLRFPSNNSVQKYIEEDVLGVGDGSGGGGGSSSGVISVNGYTGVVNLTASNIPGISEMVSQQIILSSSMPTQMAGGIWYEPIT